MPGFKPEIWALTVLGLLKERKKLIDLGDRQYDILSRNGGSAINISILGNINVQDETSKGSFAIGTTDNNNNASIAIDKMAVVTLGIGVVDQTQANQSLIQRYSAQAAKKTARSLDLRFSNTGLLGAGHKSKFSDFSASTTRLTRSTISGVQELMNDKDIDQEGRVLVVNAKGYKDLMEIPDFVDFNKISYNPTQSPLVSGIIGRVQGFDVYMLPALPKLKEDYSIGGVNDKNCVLFFQKEAIATVIQAEMIARSQYDLATAQDVLQLITLYGQKVLEANGVLAVREP